jgi:flagellar hook protein FlgE
MLRSMFTAVSSLNMHQNYLDVIADNLANSNTTGFKASRIVFQDQFAQLMSPGSSPSGTRGGINPTQIGLGAQLGYVSPLFTQGTLQSTGVNTDLAIQGDGFFVYNEGADMRFSREGSLQVDASGYLVNNSTGLRIQGWSLQAGATAVDTNSPIGSIRIPLDQTKAQATTLATLAGNLDSTTAFGAGVTPVPIEVTMAVYDSLGTQHDVKFSFTRTAADTWTYTYENGAATPPSGTLTFDTDGQLTTGNPSTQATPVMFTVPGANGADNTDFTIDMSKLTMLATESSVAETSQNGLAAGTVSDIYAAPNTGQVYLVYSNGLKEEIGQLALARFANPTGLIRDGHNLFETGLNSGDPQIGTANSNGRGSIASGYLEASNVDMAQEFTNMIMAERGFQASSKVITTSDEILQELVNLKR